MPFPTSLVGATTPPSVLPVDVRATMAYAAGIDDLNPAYLDTTRPGGVVAHPLFPVSPEWPVVLAAGRLAPGVLTTDEARVGLHVAHDLTVHRLVRPGDELRTTATVESIAEHRAGTYEVLRQETVDRDGGPVATTRFAMLFRGVAITADAGAPDPLPPIHRAEPAEPVDVVRRAVAANAAHVYTECARIWNPIHTDPVAARRAGLDQIVLHGTATLAAAVTEVVDRRADGDPTRVRRIRARFGALVTMPSTIEMSIGAATRATDEDLDLEVAFSVANQDGDGAIRHGSVSLGPPR
jgi:acyl dehydratase